MVKCIICKAISASYKCPKCKINYCSVSCFKTHQRKGCVTKLVPVQTKVNKDFTHITKDTIPQEKLLLLNQNKELHDILKNRHVRDILLEVDKSKNAADIMDRAMKEPIFVEFADICLKIVQNEGKLCSHSD